MSSEWVTTVAERSGRSARAIAAVVEPMSRMTVSSSRTISAAASPMDRFASAWTWARWWTGGS